MGFFDKIAEGIKKTRDSMMSKVNSLINSFTKIDEDFFEELEETLIMCDIGVQTSVDICAELRKKVKEKGITDPMLIKDELKAIITEMLGEDKKLDLSTKPSVVLVIGVNGAGKTTTIGKLAAQLTNQGKKVIVAAADTFRAAAIDQLQIWVDRAGADIVKHNEGSDPASVVFDAITAAKARNADVVICDTAGRLHNKKNLMDELKKIIITIHRELGIPVKLVGVGEKIDDLMEFSAKDYADALFATETDFAGNYERLTDDENEAEEDTAEEAQPADETEEEASSEEETQEEEEIPEITEEVLDEEPAPIDMPEEIMDESPVEAMPTEAAEEEIPMPDTEEQPAEPEKKSLKDGKFGFLFKEITFGKKKKDDEEK